MRTETTTNLGTHLETIVEVDGVVVERIWKPLPKDTPPLGDAIEELLTSYGITKEWYVAFKEKFGLPPTCNCEARSKWISDVASAHATIANIGVELLSFLTRKTP